MDEVRWGMIGCGDVTERKSGPAFNLVPHSRLAAVMGRNPERARDYAERHHVPRWYDKPAALLEDPEINAVYIATPPDSHMEYALLAAQVGKAVYVEKPMARTHAECQSMVNACRDAGVPLFVAYYRRCLPSFLKIRELVHSGAVGDVRYIALRLIQPLISIDDASGSLPWRVIPEIAGAGIFYDLASHQLDYLDYLFGPVISTTSQVANQASRYPAEDIVAASWRHASGVLGSGVWCFSAAEGQDTDWAEITGSLGRITFSYFGHSQVRLETGHGVEEFHFPRRDPIQQPLIQTIVDELRGEGVCPSTGESASRTNLIMEQIVYAR